MKPNLRTVKNDVIRPFDVSEANLWVAIEYRHDPAEPWRNTLERPFVVLPNTFQDVRHDALHQLNIEIDAETLKDDGLNPNDVDLVVLARDNFSKSIVPIKRESLSQGSKFFIEVERYALEATSLTKRIDLEVMLVAASPVGLKGRPIKKSARLSTHTISISTESEGLSFNFRRTSPDEFREQGLPSSTTFYVDLETTQDLITACDDISSVLRVLVHEDAWLTLQEIKAGNIHGEAIGTMFGADLLYGVISAAARSDLSKMEETSITHRILSWLEQANNLSIEEATDLLMEEDLGRIRAELQQALRLTRSIKRAQLIED